MKIRTIPRKIGETLREVVYPEGAVCLGCRRISDGRCLCPSCRDELRYSGMLYAWDRRDLEGIDAWSMRLHQGLARRLIISLKYHANSCLAEELADALLPLPDDLQIAPDTVVTWVTMPIRRRRERCVDHGRLLAEAFARRLGLPCRQLLARREDRSHTQEGLNMVRRKENLKNSYSPLCPVDFPVLLVDDVLTTGATALRCSEALRSAGAEKITVLTVTHAR